jgi:hypothetical protein
MVYIINGVIKMKLGIVLVFALATLFILPCFAGPIGDVNGDGKVNLKDIGQIARAIYSVPSDTRWDPHCDLNADNVINLKDIAIAATNFGK